MGIEVTAPTHCRKKPDFGCPFQNEAMWVLSFVFFKGFLTILAWEHLCCSCTHSFTRSSIQSFDKYLICAKYHGLLMYLHGYLFLFCFLL